MTDLARPRYDDDDDDDKDRKGDDDGFGEDYTKKLDELLNRAEPLIFQVNGSYNQYAAGVEIRPPIERATQLEQMMTTLMLMAKPTPAYRFRFQNVQATYNTYKKRWDKLVQDLDSGKIKRFAGPQRKRAG